ncbi:MAG: hypothetical protein KGI52_17185, partial [Burkholderiales bacterium]|nr:hypothetical protein [Burkholderiales bacterium]
FTDPNTQKTSQPTFTDSNGSSEVTLSGHRMLASISKAGGALMSELHLQIFGLSQSVMNDLSTLGKRPGFVSNNIITLNAGDTNSTSMAFQGNIINAFVDFDGVNVSFRLVAQAGAFQAVQNIPATSYQGTVDVATIIEGLAGQMGLQFENNGVSVKLSNPYLSGSARTQFESVKFAAGINGIIDNGVLAIWPKGGSRASGNPLISPDSGLIGYPTFNPQGIAINALFNPNVVFGGEIQVQSSITPACGTWRVYAIDHDLSCEMPGGPWFSRILAGAPGQTVVVQ